MRFPSVGGRSFSQITINITSTVIGSFLELFFLPYRSNTIHYLLSKLDSYLYFGFLPFHFSYYYEVNMCSAWLHTLCQFTKCVCMFVLLPFWGPIIEKQPILWGHLCFVCCCGLLMEYTSKYFWDISVFSHVTWSKGLQEPGAPPSAWGAGFRQGGVEAPDRLHVGPVVSGRRDLQHRDYRALIQDPVRGHDLGVAVLTAAHPRLDKGGGG